MWNAIKYNLAHLADFSGRDARPTFWWYVLFVIILQVLIGLVLAAPMAADAIGQSVEAARAGASEAEIEAQVLSSMVGQLGTQALISLILNIAVVALLSASFVRRLHDAGFPGWLALFPIATALFTAIYSYLAIDGIMAAMSEAMASGDAEAMIAVQSQTAGYSLIGWLGILFAIGFGVLKSQEGPNRYGEAPVRP